LFLPNSNKFKNDDFIFFFDNFLVFTMENPYDSKVSSFFQHLSAEEQREVTIKAWDALDSSVNEFKGLSFLLPEASVQDLSQAAQIFRGVARTQAQSNFDEFLSLQELSEHYFPLSALAYTQVLKMILFDWAQEPENMQMSKKFLEFFEHRNPTWDMSAWKTGVPK
jgi:hypothetical protein